MKIVTVLCHVEYLSDFGQEFEPRNVRFAKLETGDLQLSLGPEILTAGGKWRHQEDQKKLKLFRWEMIALRRAQKVRIGGHACNWSHQLDFLDSSAEVFKYTDHSSDLHLCIKWWGTQVNGNYCCIYISYYCSSMAYGKPAAHFPTTGMRILQMPGSFCLFYSLKPPGIWSVIFPPPL